MYRVVDRLLSGGWVLRGEDRQRRPNAAGLYAANVSTKDPVTLAGAYQRVDGAVAWMQLDNGRAEVEGLWPSWAAYGRAKELIA